MNIFILVDKRNQRIYASKSKKAISLQTGLNYHTLTYYLTKGYYESVDIIFTKVALLKSNQGGYRENAFKKK